jgi:RES domain-containing protein
MLVFRLSKGKYKDVLSGFGAALNGQRWNSKGTEVVYTAQSRALAQCEVAVHIPLGILPKDYFMVVIKVPDDLNIKVLKVNDLPRGWNAIPALPICQYIGDELVTSNEFAALKVPSVVVRGDYNFIINPKHQDFKKIEIIETYPFPFDPRIFYNK